MTDSPLKIGTRGSPLALKQAEMVMAMLLVAHEGLRCEIVPIVTSGDWKPAHGETRLSEVQGGKGLFIKEIEGALMRGDIDCAVHSMKDVPSFLPEEVAVDHVLTRDDPRDALLCVKAESLDSLPQGAIVGTSSLRRQAFLLHHRPDLQIVPIRGNVQTRIDKLQAGQVDATFLAMAGLNRLGIKEDFITPVPAERMLPACGQGVIAIETRRADARTRALLDAVHDEAAGLCVAAERAALQTLDGSCHTPIGAHATWKDGELSLLIAVGAQDGAQLWQDGGVRAVSGTEDARAFGHDIAGRLKQTLPPGALS